MKPASTSPVDPSELTFVDISSMVVAKPGRGHLHSFHLGLKNAAKQLFLESLIFGPAKETSNEIFSAFREKHFDRGLGTFFQDLNLEFDLRTINKLLDATPGKKLLHFYEGGFRELTLLAELARTRHDFISIFNLFSLDPWFHMLSRKTPFSSQARGILKQCLETLSPKVSFTVDTLSAQLRLEDLAGFSGAKVYPLFSSIGDGTGQASWESRGIDFLFSPRTVREKELVVKSLDLLARRGSETRKAVILSRWKSTFSESKLKGLEDSRIRTLVKNGGISDEEYAKIFQDTKVVVLPYLDKHYLLGSSGKVLDALAVKAIPIAPDGTSAGDLIKANDAGFTFFPSADALAGTLGSINMAVAPTYNVERPSARNSLLQILRFTECLDFGPVKESNSKPLKLLPFLAMVSSPKWSIIHLVLSPIRSTWNKLRQSG
jgi:hypothetical protein